MTDYCLIVSSKRSFTTLCAEEKSEKPADPSIFCVGRKTHYTLSNMKQGQIYYFNLFAHNRQSNLTYPLGATNTVYDSRFKPVRLKDGKATFASLKKLDGKAVFRYKVNNPRSSSLDLFVMPCGGAVDVEVSRKDVVVVPPTRIEGFGTISIPNPHTFARYYVKIFALNREELKRTNGVEVYATTKSLARIPLPNMPQIVKLKEFEGLKSCDSVTIGYFAAPGLQKSARYCLVVKEGRIRDVDDYRMPNQCGLENRLKKSADFSAKYCRDMKYEKE